MRLTLIDLLIFEALATAGMASGGFVSRWLHLSHGLCLAIGVLCAIGTVAVVSWPIYARLHFRPLWLPLCPGCRTIPRDYHVIDGEWPRFEIACGQCDTHVEVWMRRRVDPTVLSDRIVSYCLRWPEVIGWWRYVHPATPRVDSKEGCTGTCPDRSRIRRANTPFVPTKWRRR